MRTESPLSAEHARYLQALGFDCALCGADMHAPDLHAVIVARTGGREYLVDVGYAAPFYAPLPLDEPEPIRLAWGNDGYVLWPRDAQGRSRLDQLRDGARVHGYVVNPTPRALSHFEGVIRDSYADAATFMNAVRFERFSATGSVSLYNERLRVVEGGRCTFEQLAGREGIIDALEQRLGVSRELAERAVACVPELKGVHG